MFIKQPHIIRRAVFNFSALLLFCSLVYFWLYRLNEFPGLHGDEAWFGLKALDLNEYDILSLNGMNNYTGNLQIIISSLAFNKIGLDVFCLRLPGVICNIIGLLIAFCFLKRNISLATGVLFFLLLSQSIIYLTYPRIAWEVTSMSFFFLIVYGISLWNVYLKEEKTSLIWIFCYLSCGFISSYNHILFSCILFAVIIGFFINQEKSGLFPLFLSVTCLINFSLYFFVLNSKLGFLYLTYRYPTVLIFFTILFVEAITFQYVYKSVNILWLAALKSHLIDRIAGYINLTLILGTIYFLYNHGFALFQVISGEIILRTLFSYEPNLSLKAIFSIASFLTVILIIYCLIVEFKRRKPTLPAYIISSYFMCFNLYVSSDSARYYLTTVILLYLYLLYVIGKKEFLRKPVIFAFIFVSVVNSLVCQTVIWRAMNIERKVKPLMVEVGKSTVENSAHFLSYKPVIDLMKNNKIGKVNTSETFFIENPILLYKRIYPELQSYSNRLSIEYDYKNFGIGFKIEFKRNRDK